jgi:hypothetical protein
VGRLIFEPSLWELSDTRLTLIALLSAQDVLLEIARFIRKSSGDFFKYFSLWAPEDAKLMSPFIFAGNLLKLGISVETEGAGKDWKQYSLTVNELKVMAIFGASMDAQC